MGNSETTKTIRSTTWAGLHPGDPVDIDDPRAKRATFEFVALVENVATGATSVEVVGGRAGVRKLWSFRPEQVYRPGVKGRGASLNEEPQLPLG